MRFLLALTLVAMLCFGSDAQAPATVKTSPFASSIDGQRKAVFGKAASPGEISCAANTNPDPSAPACSTSEDEAFSDLYRANGLGDCGLELDGSFKWCDDSCLTGFQVVATNSPKCRSKGSDYTLQSLFSFKLCNCKAVRSDTVGKYIPVKATAISPNCTTTESRDWQMAFERNATYSKCVEDMESDDAMTCSSSCVEILEAGVRAAPMCRKYKGISYYTMDEESKKPLVECLNLRGEIVTNNVLLKNTGHSGTGTSTKETGNSGSNTVTTSSSAPSPTATSGVLPNSGSIALVLSCIGLSIAPIA